MDADVITITVSATCPEQLHERVLTVVNEMTMWCDRNRLILNENKTVFINFNFRCVAVLPDIILCDHSKFFGLLLCYTAT